jgi:hypothetical protein
VRVSNQRNRHQLVVKVCTKNADNGIRAVLSPVCSSFGAGAETKANTAAVALYLSKLSKATLSFVALMRVHVRKTQAKSEVRPSHEPRETCRARVAFIKRHRKRTRKIAVKGTAR